MEPKTDAKRHHHIPAWFLGSFGLPDTEKKARKRDIWVYSLPESDSAACRAPFLTQIENVAVEGHYFSYTRQDGTRNTSLEWAMDQIEQRTQQSWAKILARKPMSKEEASSCRIAYRKKYKVSPEAR
jgi:hypothetical protein